MDNAVLRAHNIDLVEHQKTLYELSEASGDEVEDMEKRHAISPDGTAAGIKAVDFDTVRKLWFPPDDSSLNTPCSVDALFYSDSKVYMIEFKVGQPRNLLRKVYDSALMLIEKDGVEVPQLRQNYIYIVVSSNIRKGERVLARGYEYTSTPWEKNTFDNELKQWHLKNIDGVVVSKVYVMPPDMFDDFVKTEQWN